MATHEKEPRSFEQSGELNPEQLEALGNERRNELQEQLEKKSPEKGQERIDDARHETEQVIHEQERTEDAKQRVEKPTSSEVDKQPTKRDKEAKYRDIMADTREHMSPTSRTFSKVIHNPAVERVSDATAKTVARPNAILSGSVAAFVLVLAVYLVARHYGYPLSGAETIVAFALGWVLGLMFDYFKAMYTGGRS